MSKIRMNGIYLSKTDNKVRASGEVRSGASAFGSSCLSVIGLGPGGFDDQSIAISGKSITVGLEFRRLELGGTTGNSTNTEG